MKNDRVKGFTLLELMIVVTVASILAAVAIPAFVNYMKKSKTSEAVENTRMIVEGAVSYWESDHAGVDGLGLSHCVPTSKGPSPDDNPGPERAPVNDSKFVAHFNESNGTWQALAWKPLRPFFYRYTWTQVLTDCPSPPQVAEVTAGTVSCEGDLDGDDTRSKFLRNVKVLGGDLFVGNLIRTDPLE